MVASGDVRNKIRYLSNREWELLDRTRKPLRDDLILKLLYVTGCTVGELVDIQFTDFDFRKKILVIRGESSHNNESREVFVPDKVLAKVEQYRRENDSSPYLFATRQSTSMTTKRIRQLVQAYCQQAGIEDANPQILRYTHIVHAYLKGIPIDAIQRQVGLKRSRAIEIFGQLELLDVRDAYRNF